jgi:predicted transcriptional regulator
MVRGNGGHRTPLNDVDHLARSPHRTRVLRLFATDEWTRRDLHEETGIPQPTLGRILSSFQDRNWLVRDGPTYSLTLHGRLVAAHFQHLLDAVGTVQRLPGSADLDALLELGFELDWLARADVIVPSESTGPFVHIQRVRESVRTADRVVELSPRPMPGIAELLARRLRSDDLVVETVFPRDEFLAFVADSEHRALVADMLGTGNLRLHLYDGPVPCYVANHGERAVFDVQSSEGRLIGLLTTAEPAAVEWAESVVDDFRNRAEPASAAVIGD